MNTDYSPTQLMHFAEQGILAKAELAQLLPDDPRAAFLDACAEVEKDVTRKCAAHGDVCLESGCALEGESCLNALLNAGAEYNKACGRVWLPFYRSSTHAA